MVPPKKITSKSRKKRAVSLEDASWLLVEDPPPEENEDVESVLAEMEALEACFQACFGGGSRDRARTLARYALGLKTPPKTFEGLITLRALEVCAGHPQRDLVTPPPSTKWVRSVFEKLGSGWVVWISSGNPSLIMSEAARLEDHDHDNDGGAIELTSLRFWSKALGFLTRGDRSEAKRYFDRATEVSSQFGLNINPAICWTYAASFFPKS